jgi:hypothetical protein
MAFIVVEEFVTEYLSLIDKVDFKPEQASFDPLPLEEVFSVLKTKFNKPVYSEIVQELQRYFVSL